MRFHIKATAVGLGAALLIGMQVQAAEPTPEETVQAMVDGVIQVLEARKDKTKLSEADREAIRRLVYPRMDFRTMARRALGRTWKTLDPEEQQRFVKLFRDLIEYTYGNRLSEYKGQKVRYEKAEYKKNKARVKTFVIEPDKEIPVEYRLRKTKEGWKIYDVRIEGASLVRTFRQDFQSILDRDGYEGLVKRLKEKVERLKSASS